jgi:hypothetical protein
MIFYFVYLFVRALVRGLAYMVMGFGVMILWMLKLMIFLLLIGFVPFGLLSLATVYAITGALDHRRLRRTKVT